MKQASSRPVRPGTNLKSLHGTEMDGETSSVAYVPGRDDRLKSVSQVMILKTLHSVLGLQVAQQLNWVIMISSCGKRVTATIRLRNIFQE